MPSEYILIAADIVPTRSNEQLFRDGDARTLIGEDLLSRFSSADFIAMNLEVPLTDAETPIRKWGASLIAPTDTVAGLKAVNPFFYTLANNHILDQGEAGLFSTWNALENIGLEWGGAGRNLREAAHPYVRDIKGLKLGVYCCAEHEFSIASEHSAGANPYDPLESFDHVRELKQNCDLVIVLYHGGKEHYRYPSPQLRKAFHKFADSGADYVIAQHTHCIGCAENYHGSTLVYGQGNFLFDGADNEYWQTSLLMEITIDRESLAHSCEFIPLRKCENVVRVAETRDAEQILEEFQARGERLKQEGFLACAYQQYAQTCLDAYMMRFAGKATGHYFLRILNKLTGRKLWPVLWKWQYRKSRLALINYLECEAHRELILSGLKAAERKRRV